MCKKIFKDTELAKMINKRSSNTIKHIRETNEELYFIIQLGALCKKENLNFEDLQSCIQIYKNINKSS